MVNNRSVRQVFWSTLSFRNFVFGSFCVNFLLAGYIFLTGGTSYDLTPLDGLLMYLIAGFSLYFWLFGPFILVAFFIHLSRASEPVSWFDLSNIPENSSLYDAIMLPSVQLGPIKVILPVFDEDADIEWLED